MAFLPGVPALSPGGVERKAAGAVWLGPSRTSVFQHVPGRYGHLDVPAALPMPPTVWDISFGTCLVKSNMAMPFLSHSHFSPAGSPVWRGVLVHEPKQLLLAEVCFVIFSA